MMKLKLPKLKLPSLRFRAQITESLIHTIFAGFIFALLGVDDAEVAMIFIMLAGMFFTHALLLIPYFFKKSYWSYISSTLTLSFIVFVFGIMSGGEDEVIPTIFFVWVSSGFYGFVRWNITSRMNSYAFTANTKTAELQLLKSQINPHFIFNSLNIIYSTALEENSSKTAESIAKMSNLIRYMLEDNTQEYISVHKEVKYIQDYIKLQLMRSSVEHDIDMHIDIHQDCKIAPMLLIPFVENAFKHGINPNEASTLFLNFSSNKDKLRFQLINSVDDDYRHSDFEKGFGIGISNVEKRLDLIYPRKHKLSVEREDQVFSVELEIRNQ